MLVLKTNNKSNNMFLNKMKYFALNYDYIKHKLVYLNMFDLISLKPYRKSNKIVCKCN